MNDQGIWEKIPLINHKLKVTTRRKKVAIICPAQTCSTAPESFLHIISYPTWSVLFIKFTPLKNDEIGRLQKKVGPFEAKGKFAEHVCRET